MAKWQPPIPAGALWSAEAVKLGPALALLAWCYDAVQRDGTFAIGIADAAGDLDTDYRTVKRWWSELRTGPFFSEVADKGRRGFMVAFADEWVDWRVLNARQVNSFQGTNMALEEEASVVQVPVKSPSRAGEGANMALEAPAYKVLHDDHKTHVAPLAQKRERAARPKADPASPPEVREAIAKGSAIDLRSGLQADILQVNTTARRLWAHMHQPDQPIDHFVADIRWAGKWIRKTQHPYKGSEQRIPPSALIKFWAAAMEARPPAHLNGAHVNGIGPPQPQPIRESAAEIAARMQRDGFRPPKAQDTNP